MIAKEMWGNAPSVTRSYKLVAFTRKATTKTSREDIDTKTAFLIVPFLALLAKPSIPPCQTGLIFWPWMTKRTSRRSAGIA
jgi:hypothetical protein